MLISNRERLSRLALTYLGVPYKYQGSSRAGVDCVGLLVCLAEDLGICDVQTLDNPKRRMKTDGAELLGKLSAIALRQDEDLTRYWPDQAGLGDIVIFHYPAQRNYHAAIVVESVHGKSLCHASLQAGKVVQDLPLELENLHSVWRLPLHYLP